MTPAAPAMVGEPAGAPPTAVSPGLPRGCRVWLLLCAVGASSLIAARYLHYLDLPLPDVVDRVVDRLMQESLHTTLLLVLIGLLGLLVAPVMLPVALVALVVRPRWFVRRQEEGRLATSPWLYTVLCSGIALGQGGFDLNPWVALGCAASIALVLAGPRLYSRPPAAVVAAAFLAGWAALSATYADAVAIVVWGGLLALLALLRRRWLIARDVYALGACLVVLTQVVASAVPLWWPRHGGTLLGPGMADGFCEGRIRGRLYAAVPGSSDKQFRDGHIVEYDAAQLTKLRELTFGDPTFSGRFMQLLCLPETIQVAMAQTWIDGQSQMENVMEFRIDHPDKVKRSLWGVGMGQQLLWDPKRDAIFYTSE